MSSPVTIYDIASDVGVSHVTVSNVLNRVGREGEVSKATAERIRKVAAKRGYIPNQTARNLKSGKTKTIVFLTNSRIHYPYVYELIEGIQEELESRGYQLNLELVKDFSLRDSAYQTLLPGRFDGAIVMGLASGKSWGDDEQKLMEVRRRGMPVVVTFCSTSKDLDSVDYDRIESTRLGTAHLLDEQRRRIAIIIHPEERVTNPRRLEGCRKAFAERGLPFDETMVFEWQVDEDALPLWRRMQALPALPDAIFCSNEEVAMSLMRHIRRSRLSVPRDIALATVGNTRNVRFADIPLTAVDSNHREIARHSVRLLLAQIENKKVATQRVLVQPRLFIRCSSVYYPKGKASSRAVRKPAKPPLSTSNPT